jgi:hypothetical protein
MTIEIKQTDIKGTAINVCTDYRVHTISLVDGCALGINILKAKARGEITEEEHTELTKRIEKAKALDAEQGNKEGTAKEDVVKPVDKAGEVVEVAEVATVGAAVVESEADAVEKAKAEEKPEGDPKVKAKSVKTKVEVDDGTAVETDQGVVAVEKAKMFSASEVGDATKMALDVVASTAKSMMEKFPDANQSEVVDLLHEALWTVEWALWDEADKRWNDVWDQVWDQVSNQVEKSKSLKVQTSTDPVEAMKAFAALNPEMAKVFESQMATEKAKALASEDERLKVIRQKSLDAGAQTFKRMSTDDNSTENIVDALSTIETLAPDAYTSVSKALNVASTALMAGDVFRDIGGQGELEYQTEEAYVTEKAKALVSSNGGEIAAARAEVRQTAEFSALYRIQ